MKILLLFLVSFNIYANEFIDFFSKMQSLKADFSQTLDHKKSSGVLYLAKPKKLKIHTTQPDETFLVLNHKQVTFYDVWLEVANIIEYEYNPLIESLFIDIDNPNLINSIEFAGKENNINYYKYNGTYFGFQAGQLREIITINQDQYDIYIELSNLEINLNLDNEFELNIPTTVDII